ncbi:hypothetical protein PoB_006083000 [Plakobranchus ocellatus]|uniref:Uncharacterized protein n=1 Tax=Plakobranchus ocellatus TaxID=259542 RepID=A0AAV4CR60_9GAST|nr:hypothetical protein PoB_006083000 [Plakobranchus ocellatus]
MNPNLRVADDCFGSGFLYIASPQKGDLRLLGPPSDQGADGGARTRDRRVPADIRADSQATVPPTPKSCRRLSGPPSGHSAGDVIRTRDRRVPADFRARSLSTLLATPRQMKKKK